MWCSTGFEGWGCIIRRSIIPDGHFFPNALLIYTMQWIAIRTVLISGVLSCSSSANEDWMHYCIHIKVTLGEGRGNQPPPPYAWTSSLIADIFQEGLEKRITKAMVLGPGEAVLFFGRWSLKEGLPHGKARDVAFCVAGPVTWTGRQAQVKTTVNMVQEGCWAIADAVVEKRMKAQVPGHTWGKKDQPDPCCGIQHQRVDTRHRKGWFQGRVEEWKSGKLQN